MLLDSSAWPVFEALVATRIMLVVDATQSSTDASIGTG